MSKINLEPQELRNQATQMSTLSAEYETLFSGINSILVNVNHNWSQNLANNFSGKIAAAQRSFSHVTEMLKFGSDAANSSAEAFEGIDNQLHKNMHKVQGGRAVVTAATVQSVIETSGNQVKERVFSAIANNPHMQHEIITQENLEKYMRSYQEFYEKLPEWLKELLDNYFEEMGFNEMEQLQVVLQIINEDPEKWATLTVDAEIIGNMVMCITGDPVTAAACQAIFDMVATPEGKMKEFMDVYGELEKIAQIKFENGDIAGGTGTLLMSVFVGLGTVIGYGPLEALTEMGAILTEKVGDIFFSIYKSLVKLTPEDSRAVMERVYEIDERDYRLMIKFIKNLL